jgi:hypothetical protein
MSLQWFRLYHRIVDDEKLRLLAFEDRWHFVALCCLKADGLLDTPDDSLRSRKIAVKLGVQVRELEEVGRRLQEVGLVDSTLSPASWDELQFKSDQDATAARRQREKRNRDKGLKPVTETSRVTETNVTRLDTDTDTDTDEPKGSSAKRRRVLAGKPDGISDSLWRDWLAHRKTAFTDTALEGFEREAVKAGWSLEAAIREAIERGWQGFKANWVVDKQNGQSRNDQSGMGVTERAARQAMHEIAGGVGRFEDCREQIPSGNGAGNRRTIDAMPDTMRAIGYAGG